MKLSVLLLRTLAKWILSQTGGYTGLFEEKLKPGDTITINDEFTIEVTSRKIDVKTND